MYSQVGGSLGTIKKLAPWARRHSWASVKGDLNKFLTQLPPMVLVLVLFSLGPFLLLSDLLCSTVIVVAVVVHVSDAKQSFLPCTPCRGF